jgi:hypothetical protein
VQGPSAASRPGGRAPGRALLAPLSVFAGAAAGAAVVAFVDPHEPGHYPACPSLYLTGYYCPGCGGLRMTHSLLHGDLAHAFSMNPLVLLLLPVFALVWVQWTVSAARGERLNTVLLRPKVLAALVVLLLVYWVVRNLPFAQFLAP